MLSKLVCIAGVIMAIGIGSSAGAADAPARLMAGLASVEITPPVGQPLGGFGVRLRDRGGKSEGVHDPLFARVAVLRDGDASVAIVALDLLFFSSGKVVAEAKRQWGVDHVILSSTHTHAGPIPTTGGLVEWSNLNVNPTETLDFEAFSDDPWYAGVEEKVVAAIGEAASNLFPARVGSGQGTLESAYLAHNRRHVGEDGRVRMMWDNPNRLPTEPLDHTVHVLRIDDEAGDPRAVLVGFACHPVTLGAGNRMVSADFPGAMVAHMKEELGPDVMPMFLQGASGDIDPYEMGLSGDFGFLVVRRAGEGLAKKAMRIAERIDTSQAGAGSVRVATRVLSVPHRRDEQKVSDVAVSTVVLNDDTAFVTVPGEAFVQHQINLSERSPLEHTLLMGVAFIGEGIPFAIYLPTVQAAEEGGYGADSATFLAADAGERMVDEAVAMIEALRSEEGAQ